jgi:serine/threonine protein kinase
MDMKMKKSLRGCLAPTLSNKFDLHLSDVEEVIETFIKNYDVKKVKPETKEDIKKRAEGLGLKLNAKLKKAEMLDAIDSFCNQQKISDWLQSSPEPSLLPLRRRELSVEPEPEPSRREYLPRQAKIKKGSLEGKSFTKNENTWTFGQLIGTGGFGAIYEVKEDPDLVIKTGNDALKPKQDSGVAVEKAKYIKLKSQYGDENGVPQIVDSGKLPRDIRANDYYIVMPRFEKSFQDVIDQGEVSEEQIKKIVNDILTTLEYLSQPDRQFIHLDIKPENIMLKNGRWFLIDFGLARKFDETSEQVVKSTEAGEGSQRFMSRGAHIGQYGRKSDLESLIYSMLSAWKSKSPYWFREKGKKETIREFNNFIITEKRKVFDNVDKLDIPNSFKSFIKKVNDIIPGDSPDYEDLKI